MRFELPEVTECQCTNVNVRREFHGDERVPAFDLSFSKEGSNDLLDLIDPTLRPTLYYNASADQGQAGLPDVLAILPNLRVPKLNGGKFTYAKKEKWKGYRFVLDYGLGGDSNIDVSDCAVQITEIECKEGGTCTIKWAVSFEADKLSVDHRGRITDLTDEPVFIQLIAASNLQLVTGKSPKGSAPTDPDADGPDAGDIFAQEHGQDGEAGNDADGSDDEATGTDGE